MIVYSVRRNGEGGRFFIFQPFHHLTVLHNQTLRHHYCTQIVIDIKFPTFNSICRSNKLVFVFSAKIFPNVFFHSMAWSITFCINGLRFILQRDRNRNIIPIWRGIFGIGRGHGSGLGIHKRLMQWFRVCFIIIVVIHGKRNILN